MFRSLKTAALALSSMWMSPVIYGFWLGYVRTVTVGMTSSMHLLMKLMTEVVYSLLSLDESRNIFQSVLAKQSCRVASASSDHFHIERVNNTSCFLLVSRNQEDIIMVRFAKWRARERFACVSACGVKVFFFLLWLHVTCW